jgi:hypothetical protein
MRGSFYFGAISSCAILQPLWDTISMVSREFDTIGMASHSRFLHDDFRTIDRAQKVARTMAFIGAHMRDGDRILWVGEKLIRCKLLAIRCKLLADSLHPILLMRLKNDTGIGLTEN